jgi:hypothetical protein
MKFVRKISKRDGFASLSIPKRMLDLWKDVIFVEILFNEKENMLFVRPYGEN